MISRRPHDDMVGLPAGLHLARTARAVYDGAPIDEQRSLDILGDRGGIHAGYDAHR